MNVHPLSMKPCSPAITIDTFWHSYCQLLHCFINAGHVTNADQPLANVLDGYFGSVDLVNKEDVALLPGMRNYAMVGR
jgi:hypothetical protein